MTILQKKIDKVSKFQQTRVRSGLGLPGSGGGSFFDSFITPEFSLVPPGVFICERFVSFDFVLNPSEPI